MITNTIITGCAVTPTLC